MDCVVTGGAGFIGSNLVDALVARGDRVTVIDDLSSGRRENLADALAAGAQLHELDVRDARGVAGVFAGARPQLVFHLAAQIDVRRSVADPAADAEVNVLGAINVLAAAREHGAQRVVNTSTGGGLYGDAEAAADARGSADPPARPVRAEQARRRGLFRAVRAPVRPFDGLAALRECLRAPPGCPRGGGCRRDLLRLPARWPRAAGLRRRAPDARLGRRRRCRARQPDGGRERRSRARSTSATARRRRCSTCSACCAMSAPRGP